MQTYRLEYIRRFLEYRGWVLVKQGENFLYYRPKKIGKYPPGYLLEIPKETDDRAFNRYMERLITEFPEIFLGHCSLEDFRILFSDDSSILKLRLFDNENIDGTAALQKHIESLEAFKKLLSQTVIFVSTHQSIFANAKVEVDSYLDKCRALQTEVGSFVSRIEVPNQAFQFTMSGFTGKEVQKKLFDVIDFIKDEVIVSRHTPEINENYIADYNQYINYELFNALREVYSKPKINNIEYQLSSVDKYRTVTTEKVLPRLGYFNAYLRQVKSLLLNLVALEAVGKVHKLSSSAPQSSNKNDVVLTAEIGGKEENIKLTLKSEDYLKALAAHASELKIRIRGRARQGKTMLTIYELEHFEVLNEGTHSSELEDFMPPNTPTLF